MFQFGKKEQVVQEKYIPYVPIMNVQLLPMNSCPTFEIKKCFGLLDVHLIKQSRLMKGDEHVSQEIEIFIEEANEISKAKVAALGGNYLLGYKIDLNTLEVSQREIFIMVQVLGDVVFAEKAGEENISHKE